MPFVNFTAIFWRLTDDSLSYLPAEAAKVMRYVRYLFMFSWNLSDFGQSASGVVMRTYIFTIADVLSKIVYGVLLGRIATLRPVAEGYEVDGEAAAVATASANT